MDGDLSSSRNIETMATLDDLDGLDPCRELPRKSGRCGNGFPALEYVSLSSRKVSILCGGFGLGLNASVPSKLRAAIRLVGGIQVISVFYVKSNVPTLTKPLEPKWYVGIVCIDICICESMTIQYIYNKYIYVCAYILSCEW